MFQIKQQGTPALYKRRLPTEAKIAGEIDVLRCLGPVHLADQKMLYLLTLKDDTKLIDQHLISVGPIHDTLGQARKIFRYALYDCASSIALVQNHPSGDPTPSDRENYAAEEIEEAALILEIPITQHIIVAAHGWYDFADPDFINDYPHHENIPF